MSDDECDFDESSAACSPRRRS